ncbi:MAG: aspartate-semialdehyde dehydrogenase [Actinomycetia bacterium]|nr:aspartate-semialdehyde dehydrogenase [Actinomycetes bacterium]
MPADPVVAVAGATGAVGREMLKVLEQRAFPASRVLALASERSAGQKLSFGRQELLVEAMTPASFQGVDLVLFAAGSAVVRALAPAVNAAGAVIIDNSSEFRMAAEVPLVVPEVNPDSVWEHSGIIANPNCSTIQMVVALAPLRQIAPIRRVVVSTYQAASGAGAGAMRELYEQSREFLADKPLTIEHLVQQIAFNCIPQIDVFRADGSTKEEWKMAVETQKILADDQLRVAANCVRVPVLRSHSEMINVEFSAPVSRAAALAAWQQAPGIQILDDPSQQLYPMPARVAGTDAVYLGRIREDPTVDFGLSFWCVADQLRKGAALNAVQIAELLLSA